MYASVSYMLEYISISISIKFSISISIIPVLPLPPQNNMNFTHLECFLFDIGE